MLGLLEEKSIGIGLSILLFEVFLTRLSDTSNGTESFYLPGIGRTRLFDEKINTADTTTPENWQEYTTALFRNQDPAKLQQRLDVVPEI